MTDRIPEYGPNGTLYIVVPTDHPITLGTQFVLHLQARD